MPLTNDTIEVVAVTVKVLVSTDNEDRTVIARNGWKWFLENRVDFDDYSHDEFLIQEVQTVRVGHTHRDES